jgi:hypothetical protein
VGSASARGTVGGPTGARSASSPQAPPEASTAGPKHSGAAARMLAERASKSSRGRSLTSTPARPVEFPRSVISEGSARGRVVRAMVGFPEPGCKEALVESPKTVSVEGDLVL